MAAGAALAVVSASACQTLDEEGAEPTDTSEEAANGEAPDPEPVTETVAEGFDEAWGLAFLPGTEQLAVTELSGALSVVDTGTGDVVDIDGVPEVDAAGQGGLLDVAVDPDFPEQEWLYLTYSAEAGNGGTTTYLARGQLDTEQESLTDVEELFSAEPAEPGEDHYGSKLAFGPDGHLFMTIGDRADKDFDDHPSQDTSNTLGTTVRLEPDGSVPEDNPFVDDPDFADEIYSYGHRNAQGMTVHPETGELWQSEHGEQEGDEINIVQAGGNHGWPVTHTGCEYGTDTPVGDHPSERDDIVDPVHYWECGSEGFPPAGMAFYEGDEFPAWEGDLLVGSLASEYLARFTVDGDEVEEEEELLADEGWRIRNVVVGPHDGALYIALDEEDAPLVRLVDGADD
ncbi:PQQ-dependent sugar dehydrogenase [Nocardiopsis oceani]